MKIKNGMMGGSVLDGRPDRVKRSGDHMILNCHTEGQAEWTVQVAFDHRDITALVRNMLLSRVPLFLITGFRSRKSPRPPVEF